MSFVNHIVLVAPEIPHNTGSIGRLAVATRSQLHLIEPLGFELSDKYLKRAGLDYWQHLDLKIWPDWESFERQMPFPHRYRFFTKFATKQLFSEPISSEPILIFGRETKGLPRELTQRFPDQCLRIPMLDSRVRSLNLATAVGIAVYEAMRSNGTKLD